MTYAISDIHGEKDRFDNMLKLISFNDNDQLIIIGDVIDRGPEPIELLEKIRSMKNIILLCGNHEYMCIKALRSKTDTRVSDDAMGLWWYNGGIITYSQIIKASLSQEKTTDILNYLESLPLSMNLEMDDSRIFHFIHGAPLLRTDQTSEQYKEDSVWMRVDQYTVSPYKNVTTIVGHTPTNFITNNSKEPCKIWHNPANSIIDIDCGCGHIHNKYRQLACLRLDDMAEFYV